ncbi:hypothetical protein FJTKL_14024 [Diaporthe vaccinii]|uniref:Uncharacterized protein n=1 Tax=Diaporthe vaccinii TaxID=105482 RepID=A0ABR4E9F3_9PEZI
MKPEEACSQLGAMQQSLEDNGFDFDLTLLFPRPGYKPDLDKLDQAEHVDGINFGRGLCGHPSPSIAIFELIETVRHHPKKFKILTTGASHPASAPAREPRRRRRRRTTMSGRHRRSGRLSVGFEWL